MKTVSIVSPLFNEEDTVELLVERLAAAVAGLPYEFEFIFVDDGSRDRTLERLLALHSRDSRIKVVELSRNWGFQCAYNAGLDTSAGDAVVLMDGDLQDPPELIPRLLEEWESGAEVVYTVKRRRKESWIKQAAIAMFYRLMQRFSNVEVERQAGMFSLLSRRAADELRACGEKHKFYVGLRSFIGFVQARVEYERDVRFAGPPKNSFTRLVNYALNAFFAFSFLPIRLLTYFGVATLAASLLAGIILVTCHILQINIWFFTNYEIRTYVILLFLVMNSTMIVFLGIIGEYIARIYDEVRKRPNYIINKIHS